MATSRYARLRAAGLCIRCKAPALNKTYCVPCGELHCAKKREYLARRTKERIAAGRCADCNDPNGNGKALCGKCLARLKQVRTKQLTRLGVSYTTVTKRRYRAMVLDHYGNSTCARCQESIPEFLAVDHIQNIGKGRMRTCEFMKWLVHTQFPPGYQILCHNCNWLKYLESARANLSVRDGAEKRRRWSAKLKQQVLQHYGSICACCGERNPGVLGIDHPNNDGAKHRARLRGNGRQPMSSSRFYKWLRNNNYPPGYQILCGNCNLGKAINRGVCPHVSATGHDVEKQL